jgi:hypothetical protein
MSGSSPSGVRWTVGVGPGAVSAAGVESGDEQAPSVTQRMSAETIFDMKTTIPD